MGEVDGIECLRRRGQEEFQTSTQVGHKYIPPVHRYVETLKLNIPDNLAIQDYRLVQPGFVSTYAKDFDHKPLDETLERFSQGETLLDVKYLDSTQTRFFRDPPRPIPPQISTTKDSYSVKYLPRCFDVKNYTPFCKLQTIGLAEQPPIPPEEKGYMKLMDPMLTTKNEDHVPFTKNQWNGIGKKDVLTIYDFIVPKIPKCKGFGVKDLPYISPHFIVDPIADKVPFKFTPKLQRVPTKTKHVPHSGLRSETQLKFKPPNVTPEYWFDTDRSCFEYQEYWPTDIPWKFMQMPGAYNTESKHIGSGCPTNAIVNQDSRLKLQRN